MAELRELVQAAEDALHAVREAVEAQETPVAPGPEVETTTEDATETTEEATPEVSTPSEPTAIPVTDASDVPEVPVTTETPVVGPAVAPSDAPLPV